MIENMLKGTISHYNDIRGFGFITIPGRESIFFHNTRQRHVTADCDRPVVQHFWEETAEAGEPVYVDVEDGPKGPRARFWIKERVWNDAVRTIAERRTIRFMKRQGKKPISRLHERPVIMVLWSGTSLNALRGKYRRDYYPAEDTEDVELYFEQEQPDGSWQRIGDPR